MTFQFSWASVGWLAWILMFFAIEGHALIHGYYLETLTAHLRWLFGMDGKEATGLKRFRRVLLIAFLGWFSLHLLLPPGWF